MNIFRKKVVEVEVDAPTPEVEIEETELPIVEEVPEIEEEVVETATEMPEMSEPTGDLVDADIVLKTIDPLDSERNITKEGIPSFL